MDHPISILNFFRISCLFRRVIFIFSLVFILSSNGIVDKAQSSWSSRTPGFFVREMLSLEMIRHGDEEIIIALTRDRVLMSASGDMKWRVVYPGEDASVCAKPVSYSFDPDSGLLCCVTDKGIIMSSDMGVTWARETAREKSISDILIVSGTSLLAANGREAWEIMTGEENIRRPLIRFSEREKFHRIIAHREKGEILIVTSEGLYRTERPHLSFERILYAQDLGMDEIKAFDCLKENYYLAASDGDVFYSGDQGSTWNRIAGLNCLQSLHADSESLGVAAVTDKGEIYSYDAKKGEWSVTTKIDRGITINDLAFKADEHILAATNRGIFQFREERLVNTKTRFFSSRLPENDETAFEEPSGRQIQMAALQFYDLSPNKNRRWLKNASRSRYLPSLKITFDYSDKKTKSLSIENSLGISSDGTVVLGPDQIDYDETEQEAYSFQVSLVWNPGELLFNRDLPRTAKLIRHLSDREREISATVLQLYSERKKLITSYKENEKTISMEERILLALEIEETSARIDNLTGGFFSSYVNVNE